MKLILAFALLTLTLVGADHLQKIDLRRGWSNQMHRYFDLQWPKHLESTNHDYAKATTQVGEQMRSQFGGEWGCFYYEDGAGGEYVIPTNEVYAEYAFESTKRVVIFQYTK